MKKNASTWTAILPHCRKNCRSYERARRASRMKMANALLQRSASLLIGATATELAIAVHPHQIAEDVDGPNVFGAQRAHHGAVRADCAEQFGERALRRRYRDVEHEAFLGL